MSRAFIKETDDAGELPDRPVSAHPNLVTADGLAAIDGAVARLDTERARIAPEDRVALARVDRDLRYWRARRATAQLVEPPKDSERVQFGSTVTIRRDDQRQQTLRIVGEDEADPGAGKVSYVSPLVSAVMGKRIGDIVDVGPVVVEILAISD